MISRSFAIILTATCTLAIAQPQIPPKQLPLDQLPAPTRLGVRSEQVRQAINVIPVVVIVPDAASYVEAIARWTPAAHYPVLIDNGAIDAREHIARFVRGFTPRQVVRWSFGTDGTPAAWPDDIEARKLALTSAAARAWGRAEKEASLREYIGTLRDAGLTPPGIAICDVTDQAWTAALAIAAGRGLPFGFLEAPQGVNEIMDQEAAERLVAAVERSIDEAGMPWRTLGDAIDAVALCVNIPSRMQVKAALRITNSDQIVALTDRIGRHGTGPVNVQGRVLNRWGWAGQIFGNEADGAYAAMCALFLQPRSGLLVDTYPPELPWSEYSMADAAQQLRSVKLSTILETQASEHWWRAASVRPVEAGMILVNTKGSAGEFGLTHGVAQSGDVPLLDVPASVYFVHSWSAQKPSARATIAGRWLERGAYAYTGSVDEPFLQAFVPTPRYCERMASQLPLAAAARHDDAPLWKIAVFGDPLITLGPLAPRSRAELPLAGAQDLEDARVAAIKERRLEDAVVILTLLGRDRDVARLVGGLAQGDAQELSGPIARASILPLTRTGSIDALVKATRKLGESEGDAARFDRGPTRDALWLAAYPRILSGSDRETLEALRDNIRDDQVVEDALRLLPAWSRVFGADAAAGMIGQVKAERARTDAQRARLDKALSGESGGRRRRN